MAAKWAQKTIILPSHKRGCHLITSQVRKTLTCLLSVFSAFSRLVGSSRRYSEPEFSAVVEDLEPKLDNYWEFRVMKEIQSDLSQFKCGLAHLFLQHTSASLTINENYDSDVLDDVETFLNDTVPEGRKARWKHVLEGPDDMPAHIKSSMFGCSVTIPITDGRLNLGTWQGIWLCEHRDHGSARKVVITMQGA